MELCEAKPAKLRFILTEYIFQPWVTPSTQPAEGTKLQGLQVLEESDSDKAEIHKEGTSRRKQIAEKISSISAQILG